MESRTWGYARVSTKEQNLDRQLIALMESGVEERNIITDTLLLYYYYSTF